MTVILAIDTATGPCSVAIWRDGHIAAYVENVKPVMQSASLMPMVEQALAQSSTGYHDLTAVACTVGPGSFTGIRVGVATARGIAFAAHIPGIGATTLDVLTAAARPHAAAANQPILAILNAGKGEFYFQLHASAPQLGTLASALALAGSDALVVGNATADAPVTFPRADALALLAASDGFIPRPLTPFYIRDPDAKLPAGNI